MDEKSQKQNNNKDEICRRPHACVGRRSRKGSGWLLVCGRSFSVFPIWTRTRSHGHVALNPTPNPGLGFTDLNHREVWHERRALSRDSLNLSLYRSPSSPVHAAMLSGRIGSHGDSLLKLCRSRTRVRSHGHRPYSSKVRGHSLLSRLGLPFTNNFHMISPSVCDNSGTRCQGIELVHVWVHVTQVVGHGLATLLPDSECRRSATYKDTGRLPAYMGG